MESPPQFSRRERQIIDILYARGASTVMEVLAEMPDPPSDKSVRGLLEVMEKKGHVKRRKRGRENIYAPTLPRKRAGQQALKHLLETFFNGGLDDAVVSHLESPKSRVSEEELENIRAAIEQAREEGR